jgi:4-hydroxybutyrate CoA-transferase
VPAERLDYVVESERAIPELPLPPMTPEAERIGAHVAGIVRDGDCIQTGIGSIPFAVLAALGEKNDLGIHSGILDDAGRRLIESGVVTGKHKTIDRDKVVFPIATGSAEFYAWVGRRPEIELRPVSYTHHVPILARIDNFVSINSAIEVDLNGQLNAEMIGSRQVSGAGGSVDFMRGAALSDGGRSIIAMTSTAAGGKLSRIVPALAAGTAATALRTDIDYVVTEHGTARLRNRPLAARAEALIEISDPRFRDQLRAAARGESA